VQNTRKWRYNGKSEMSAGGNLDIISKTKPLVNHPTA